MKHTSKSFEMFSVLAVYVVFQVSLLGSLLASAKLRVHTPLTSSSLSSSTWGVPHFYLSAVACAATLVTLVLSFLVSEAEEEEYGGFVWEGFGDVEEQVKGGREESTSALWWCYEMCCRVVLCVHVAAYPVLVYASSQRVMLMS